MNLLPQQSSPRHTKRSRYPSHTPSDTPLLKVARVETAGSLVRHNKPTHVLDHSGTQNIYTSIANNQCWPFNGKFYMVNLPVYSDNPLINLFLELTTTLLINPIGSKFNIENAESVQSANADLQLGVKKHDVLSEGIYTFMTCHNDSGEIMIFLMKAETIFEFGTKHIQMLHRARKFIGISWHNPLNIWYTGEISKTAHGIKYNFMSGTFSMQRYTKTPEQLVAAKDLVETILGRLGHTNVKYTPLVLLTSETLPLNVSDLKFFKDNHVGVYEFEDENNCDQFNMEVQRMRPDDTTTRHLNETKLFAKSKEHETKQMDTAVMFHMFHRHQDELAARPDFIKILKTYKGTIYTSDKKCDDGILTKCVKGAHWLTKLYTDLYNGIMHWRDIRRRVGGRRTNKMKMRKFRPRTRRNRSRRERRK